MESHIAIHSCNSLSVSIQQKLRGKIKYETLSLCVSLLLLLGSFSLSLGYGSLFQSLRADNFLRSTIPQHRRSQWTKKRGILYLVSLLSLRRKKRTRGRLLHHPLLQKSHFLRRQYKIASNNQEETATRVLICCFANF